MAAPASAQGEAESMMVLGGYTNYTVSFTKHPEGQLAEQEGDIEIYNNTEIFFNGSAETDGGLQVSARVELEGYSENDQIDEHYITVSGGFGSLEIGANDGADERTAKGIFYNSTGVDYWYYNDVTVPTKAGYRGVGIFSDGMGVVYTTPSLGGASFAIGYKPSREDGTTRGSSQSGDENVFSFGAKYEGDMDGITFAGSVGYGTWDAAAVPAQPGTFTATTIVDDMGTPDDTTDDTTTTNNVWGDPTPAKLAETYTVWGVGANLGFGDTTLYARYQDEETEPEGRKATERTISSLAISHALGPVKLGLGWVQSTRTVPDTEAGLRGVTDAGEPLDLDPSTTGTVPTGSERASVGELENEDTMLIGSVDYSLGSGVTLGGYVAWGETEQTGATHAAGATAEDGNTGPAKDEANSESATAFGVALNLAF